MSEEISRMFNEGDTHRIIINGKSYKAHIKAIVDGNYVVYKWFGKHRQWWHYDVDCFGDFQHKIHLQGRYLNEQ